MYSRMASISHVIDAMEDASFEIVDVERLRRNASKLSAFGQICGSIQNRGSPETCRFTKSGACERRGHRDAKTQRKTIKTL